MKNKWTDFYNNHGRFYLMPHPKLTKFINLLKKKNSAHVLDLGCGSGRHIVRLAEEGFQVSGIDYSPSAAQLAQQWVHQKGLEATIIVGDFDDKIKDFDDNSFDGILAINTLEYGEENELQENLSYICDLLKSQGLVLIVYRSKKSTLKYPDVPIQILDKYPFKALIEQFFSIIDFEQDNNENFVALAEKKN